VDSVVGFVGNADEILWVQQNIGLAFYVLCRDWIKVMNQDSAIDFMAFHSEIAAVVSDNDLIPNFFPFTGAVKDLIQISVKSKGLLSDDTVKPEVGIAFLERSELG